MSKMNLQKLRQVCYLNDDSIPVMEITLPANDPLNRVEFTDKQGNNRSAQARAINFIMKYPMSTIDVTYSTEEDLSRLKKSEIFEFNIEFSKVFLPRLKQILVENGFHSKYLPIKATKINFIANIVRHPVTSNKILNQITHACYYNGRSMRAAVEYQSRLNKL